MPAVVVDSSVLISLAAGEQFQLFRTFYTTIYIPPEVWHEVCDTPKPYGSTEVQEAHSAGWLLVQVPGQLRPVTDLNLNLQAGETQALALALELPGALLIVDDTQGRRAAQLLGIAFTGTLGVLLRAKLEGRISSLRTVLDRLRARTTFWLGEVVQEAALKRAGEIDG